MSRHLPSELHSRRPTKCAIAVGGKTVSRWPVLVSVSTLFDRQATVVDVIAPTASDAAHLIQDEYAQILDLPFEVTVPGPRGGIAAYLFAGYERLIGLKLMNCRNRPVSDLSL